MKLYQFVLALLIGLVGGAYLGTIATQERTRTVVHRLTVTAPRPPLTYIPPESSITPEGARQLPPAKGLTLTAPSRLVTPAVLELLEQEEGYDRCAYLDPFALVWTVGFGQTHLQGGRVPPGFCFANESAAVGNLKYAVEHEGYLAAVVAVVGRNQPPGVYEGEISFDYNVGALIYQGQLRADLERHDYATACVIQKEYVHAGGAVLPDLVRRRARECALILAPGPKPQPTRAQLEVRRRVLVRYRTRYGCVRREQHHQATGARCKRWHREQARIDFLLSR